MNADIAEAIKIEPYALISTCPKDITMPHKILGKPCDSVGADILTIIKKNYLCIVDSHSLFPVMKMVKGFSTDKLI